jgi:ppGpp synthetase/RelA/SpoT-type nucleotidyltranferase
LGKPVDGARAGYHRAGEDGTHIAEKLIRDHATPLQNVQDFAGVRFEANMTLTEQTVVAEAITDMFEHDRNCIHDLRVTPHSGYRAVHVWLRLPAGRVEIQVRTHLQGEWANAYERHADVLGRGIRYGELPEIEIHRELVVLLQDISTEDIADLERSLDEFAASKVEYERFAASERPPEYDEAFARLRDNVAESEEHQIRMLRNARDRIESLGRGT